MIIVLIIITVLGYVYHHRRKTLPTQPSIPQPPHNNTIDIGPPPMPMDARGRPQQKPVPPDVVRPTVIANPNNESEWY